VINQVKEAFLDENVDIDVLQQLKKEWEDKVVASGCVDFDGSGRQQQMNANSSTMSSATAARNNAKQTTTTTMRTNNNTTQQQQQSNNMAHRQVIQQQQSQHIQQVHYLSAPAGSSSSSQSNIPLVQNLHTIQGANFSQGAAAAQAVLPTGAISFAADQNATGAVRMMQHAQTGQQYAIMQGGTTYPGMQQGFVLMSAHGQQIPVTVTAANLVHMPRSAPVKSEPALQQLDGATDSSSASSSKKKKHHRVLAQLDGAAGLSDSSEDDDDVEDDDDDDDPLRRMVDRIGGDGGINDDEDQAMEEDPLNSGDDQSDDEDIDTLFDADNVVVCQFEKVHRARSKWKFTLKDGIMHLQGKDYAFLRCAGEAEW